jgi:hypothetical protein
MSEELNLDELLVREVEVVKDKKRYVLKAPSEGANIRVRNSQMRGARLVDGKLTMDAERLADSQSLLVSLCLFDEGGRPVPLSVIQSWPALYVKAIFDKAKELGGMDEEESAEALERRLAETQRRLDALRNGHTAEESAKNSPGATTGTSA